MTPSFLCVMMFGWRLLVGCGAWWVPATAGAAAMLLLDEKGAPYKQQQQQEGPAGPHVRQSRASDARPWNVFQFEAQTNRIKLEPEGFLHRFTLLFAPICKPALLPASQARLNTRRVGPFAFFSSSAVGASTLHNTTSTNTANTNNGGQEEEDDDDEADDEPEGVWMRLLA